MRLKRLISLAILIISCVLSFAQITADEAIVEMGRGINMGNTLDATDYEGGTWAPAAEEYFFEMYKEAGYNTVRIPITWNAGVSESNQTPRLSTVAPYVVSEDFFKRLDTIVAWSLDRGMYTIINVHHDGWVKNANTFNNNKSRLYALWEQIADHYKDYPEHLFFEILNEPHSDNSLTTAQVNELNSECLDIIRATNPTRVTIYMGPNWSSAGDLKAAAVPAPNDEYLMGSYHSYNPWPFAGEAKGTWGTTNDKQTMTDQMEDIKAWSDEKSIPVFIGELGAMNSCEYNSRMRYYAHYIQEAMRIGLAFAVWDDDGWFQTLERRDSSWNDANDVILHTTEQSPTNVSARFNKSDDTTVVVSWRNRATGADSIFLQERINDTEFITIAKFTDNTESYTDTVFEEKNYYYYRVIARYNDSIDVYSYPARVFVAPTKRAPFLGEPFAIPGTVEAEDFDEGGQTLTYNETTDLNQGGAEYRPGEIVDIEAREDGGYHIGYVENGEWLEYTVNIEEEGAYTVTAVVATQVAGGVMGVNLDGKEVARIEIPNTGSWETTQEKSTNITVDEAGEQTLRLRILSENAYNIDKLIFTKGHTASNQNLAYNTFTVYPNPATSQLFIDAAGISNRAIVELISLTGKIVFSTNFDQAKNGIAINQLENGYYIVRISDKEHAIVKQFVKQ